VLQLVGDRPGFGPYLTELKTSVTGLETAHLRTMDQTMRREAAFLGLKPAWSPFKN
jgi:hypothetical protein